MKKWVINHSVYHNYKFWCYDAWSLPNGNISWYWLIATMRVAGNKGDWLYYSVQTSRFFQYSTLYKYGKNIYLYFIFKIINTCYVYLLIVFQFLDDFTTKYFIFWVWFYTDRKLFYLKWIFLHFGLDLNRL